MVASDRSQPIAIVVLCDDGYEMPTSVAITSLIQSKHPKTCLDIHIVCACLSKLNDTAPKMPCLRNAAFCIAIPSLLC